MSATSLGWPEIFHEQYSFVYSVVRRLAGPDLDPDDLTQDVFIVVHRKLNTIRDASRLRAWIYGICRRVVAGQRRKKKLRAALRVSKGPPEAEDEVATPERQASGLELERRLYAAIDKLTPKRREVLILFALQELSGREISEMLQIPEATVWTRLHAARQQLVSQLDPEQQLQELLR